MGFPNYNFICEALFGSSAHVESVCTAQNIPPKCWHKAVEQFESVHLQWMLLAMTDLLLKAHCVRCISIYW